MTLEELWKMTKTEFDKLNKRVDVLENKVEEIDVIKEKLNKIDEIDEIKEKLSKIDEIDEIKEKLSKIDEIDEIKKKVNQIDEKMNVKFDSIDDQFAKINDKLNIMSNINMAKILEHQVETRKELNEKIDKLILQNNVEHKKFAYQIAQLEMNEGFTKIG